MPTLVPGQPSPLDRLRHSSRRDGVHWHAFRHWQKRLASLLLLVYLVVAVELTLVRFPRFNPPWNLVPFRTILHDLGKGGSELAVNTLGNVVATIPFGILVPIVFDRRTWTTRQIALASFGASLLVESAQAWSGCRVADVDDLILNTLGGVIGHGILGRSRRFLFRTHTGSSTPGASPGEASKIPPPTPL